MSQIKVTIDRVVLNGIYPAGRSALVDALRGELSRGLADRTTSPAWEQSRHTPVLRLGRLPLEPGAAGGRKLGQGIARAVGGRLKP